MPFCPLFREIASTEDLSLEEREGRKHSPVDWPSELKNRAKNEAKRHVQRFHQMSIQDNSLTIHTVKENLPQNFNFLSRPDVHPTSQLVTNHHSLSTNLFLHPSSDLAKFFERNLTLLKSGEG